MSHGTMADTAGTSAMTLGTTTAGTSDGMEDFTQVSTIHGTTIHGIQDSMILTTITCTHTIADGMVAGDHTLEESTIGHIMEADTL